MFLLGYDVGSSSVKCALVDAQSGQTVASAFYPAAEAPISSPQSGFAEQNPGNWWGYLKEAMAAVLAQARARVTLERAAFSPQDIKAIGISYQMHGLVCIDKDHNVLRPSIIWCDSRAVPYGQEAFEALGAEWCLQHLLNSPGNFTAAKLAWVKENEPAVYERIWKVLLPGDYIAMRLTGSVCTTVGGLSEGIFWDFAQNRPSSELMAHFGFAEELLPPVRPTFGVQGYLSGEAAAELGLAAGIPVTYRAGDQPNNALSLNVFNPGEIASTAGTSGVVYGVNGQVGYDPLSRVNSFAHVNHTAENPRLGVLLCINGTGILNSWIRRNVAPEGMTYPQMNALAADVPIGSDGLSVLPFGNGAERMLCNRNPGCSVHGLQFNRHSRAHLVRAAQEGIVFAFQYGIELMEEMGIPVKVIHAGMANLFLSPVFRETLAGVSGAVIELYDTNGAAGAAKGAGIGAGIYKNTVEAFASLERLSVVTPAHTEECRAAYEQWKTYLKP